jgi:hypothetical protein
LNTKSSASRLRTFGFAAGVVLYWGMRLIDA